MALDWDTVLEQRISTNAFQKVSPRFAEPDPVVAGWLEKAPSDSQIRRWLHGKDGSEGFRGVSRLKPAVVRAGLKALKQDGDFDSFVRALRAAV